MKITKSQLKTVLRADYAPIDSCWFDPAGCPVVVSRGIGGEFGNWYAMRVRPSGSLQRLRNSWNYGRGTKDLAENDLYCNAHDSEGWFLEYLSDRMIVDGMKERLREERETRKTRPTATLPAEKVCCPGCGRRPGKRHAADCATAPCPKCRQPRATCGCRTTARQEIWPGK